MTSVKRWVMVALVVVLAVAVPAAAAEPVSKTFSAPADRVWSTTEAILKVLGWDIDKADRTVGWITTDSRKLDGEDYGVYAKGLRHQLRLNIRATGDSRTAVSIERNVFKRERILWMDKDEAIAVTDHGVEQDVLSAIEKAL
jgi:hypothetical protein